MENQNCNNNFNAFEMTRTREHANMPLLKIYYFLYILIIFVCSRVRAIFPLKFSLVKMNPITIANTFALQDCYKLAIKYLINYQ